MPVFTAAITLRSRKHCTRRRCPPRPGADYPEFMSLYQRARSSSSSTCGSKERPSSMPSTQGSSSNGTPPLRPSNGDRACSPDERPFKERRTFDERRRDVEEIMRKHPRKIPLVIERSSGEKNLPILDKTKFLVPEELTMSQLTAIIRKRMQISESESFYLLVNRKALMSTSLTILEVYKSQRDEDGFLYMMYASQEMFG